MRKGKKLLVFLFPLVLFALTGSKIPPQNSAKEVRWGSTARKSRLVQLIIIGDEQNPND